MKEQFEILRSSRSNVISILNKYSSDQLNTIPGKFKNNLIWNAGHILVTQQSIVYRLSGLDIKIDQSLVDLFKKGAQPENKIDEETIAEIKRLLVSTVSELEQDYSNGIFREFKPYMTSYGYELKSVEDAINFNNTHEGLHIGYMLALGKNFQD